MPARALWQPLESLESRTLLATVTWDGGGGDNSWHNPLNWSGDVVPGAADDVVLDRPGNLTITHSQGVDTTIKSLRNNETLNLNGGVIRTTTAFKAIGPVNMTGGAIGGTGNLQISSGFTWSGGHIAGAGKVQIGTGGKLLVSGPVLLSRQVVNNGTITWSAGDWRFADGSIINLAGRTMNLQSHASIVDWSGTNRIFNSGSILRNGTSATASNVRVSLNSTSLIEVRAGRLNVIGGGNANGGTVRAGVGTTLAFSGIGYQIASNTTLEGAGTVRLVGGNQRVLGTLGGLGRLVLVAGGLNYEGAGSVQRFDFESGLFTRTGNMTVTVAMTWLAGTMAGVGTLIIGPNATLTASGGATKGLSGLIDNQGEVAWTAGTLKFTAGRIVNKGEFTTNTQRFFSGGGTNQFINAGTLTKTGGGSLTFENTAGGVSLTNQPGATVTVQQGALRLFGGGNSRGTITGEGQGSLVFDWLAYTIAGGLVTDVPSISMFSTVLWTGGEIAGQGLLIVAGSSSLTLQGAATKKLSRSVANSGTLSWTGGNLVLNFVTVTNAGAGEFNLLSSGTLTATGGTSVINNAGTMKKFGGGHLNLSAQDIRFSNTGTLDVRAGAITFAGARLTNLSGNVLSGGVWELRNGATVNVQGADIQTNNADVRFHGTGRISNFASLRGNGGILRLSEGAQFTTAPGGTTPNFVNAGRLTVDSTSLLAVTGNLTLTSSSILEIDVASAAAFGRVTVTLTANLSGDVRGHYEFTPAVGAMFQIVTAGTRLGEFTSGSATGLPGSLRQFVRTLSNGARFEIQNA